MKKLFLFSVILLTLVGFINAGWVVDQQQNNNAGTAYEISASPAQNYIEETFVPTVNQIDAVDVMVGTNPVNIPNYNFNAIVEVRGPTPGNTLVFSGTIDPSKENSCNGCNPHYEKAMRTSGTGTVFPGITYKIVVKVNSQPSTGEKLYVYSANSNTYASGQLTYYQGGIPTFPVDDIVFTTQKQDYVTVPTMPTNGQSLTSFQDLSFQWQPLFKYPFDASTAVSGQPVRGYWLSVDYLGDPLNSFSPATFQAPDIAFIPEVTGQGDFPTVPVPATQLAKQPSGNWRWKLEACVGGTGQSDCVRKNHNTFFAFSLYFRPEIATITSPISSSTRINWDLTKHNAAVAGGATHSIIKLEGVTPGTLCYVATGALPSSCYIPVSMVSGQNFFQFTTSSYNALTGPAGSKQFRISITPYKSPTGSTLPTWWTATDSVSKARKVQEVAKIRFGTPQTFTKP